MIELDHRRLAVVSQNLRLNRRRQLLDHRQHLLHFQVGLHRDHHRNRVNRDVFRDRLRLLVVVQAEILDGQAVDDVAALVRHGNRRHDKARGDGSDNVGFVRRRRVLRPGCYRKQRYQ